MGLLCTFANELNKKIKPLSISELQKELKNRVHPESFSGHFIQHKVIKEFGINLSTEGQFDIIQNKQKNSFLLKWKILKPEESEVCIDDKNITMTTPQSHSAPNNGKNSGLKSNQKKIVIAEIGKSSESLILIIKLLKFNPSDLNQLFIISKSSKNDFILNPQVKSNSNFKSIQIHFNSMGFIDKTLIIEKNYDETVIEFSEFKVHSSQPNSLSPTEC